MASGSKKQVKKRILFLCYHNSARSQMAEGVLRAMHGDRCEVSSAGVEASQVDPRAIRAMSEIGVDISSQHSKSMNEYRGIPFDITVTVCDRAKEVCPICGASLIAPVHTPAARKTIHKNFRDPATAEGSEEERLAVFRQVRDEIREWIEKTFK